MQFLPKNISDTITTGYQISPEDGGPPIHRPQEWTILEKLTEHPVPIFPEDVASGMGAPYTVGRYLCHPVGDENALAYMRIYKQIPQTGTEFESVSVRKAQATNRRILVELDALMHLTDTKCTPKLLGWQYETQGPGDLIPDGYTVRFIWEKVQGEPLSSEKFWSLPYHLRETIRQNFKKAYSEILKSGFKILSPVPRHIIIDRATYDVKISGFRRTMHFTDETRKQWNDIQFIAFQLVLASEQPDMYLPKMAPDVETREHGWRW